MAQGRISGRLLKDDLARDNNLTFDTNTLVVDYGNSKVGIGTVSPSDILTVSGNTTLGNIQVSNNQIISVNANAHIVLNPNGTGNIDVSSTNITNVADPLSAQDAATKAYVDAQSSAVGNLEINDTTFTSVTASDNIIIDAETGVFIIEGTTGFVIPVGNTAQRSGSPDTGLTRYNSETGLLEIYDGSSWESMGDYAATVDSFDGDNSTTDFVMSAESTTDGTIVDINGVVQLPTTAYTVTGNTISFTEAPGAGDKVTTRLLVSLVGTSAQAAGSDTQVQFNDSDALAGDSGFTFNKTTNAVTITGNITGGNLVTGAQVVATGNVTGGNIIATGNVVGTVSGYDIGYRNIPQVASGNVTLALTDSGKHYYSTTSATETITIPPNSSVAFDTGSAIMIVNKGSGTVDIARGSGVALYLAGNSTSANRSVSSYGMATLIKTGTDEWFVSGTGVS